MSDLLDFAEKVMKQALAKGADEATLSLSEGSHTTIQRRAGKVEQASEASTRGMSIAVMAEGKFSSHSTSDLRPDALQLFVERALDATSFLEADPDRALPDAELCGRGVSEEQLDQLDPAWAEQTAAQRADWGEALEKAVTSSADERAISSTVFVADGWGRSVRVQSNGFSGVSEGAWFSAGGETTLLAPDGRRPEAYAYYGARYQSDLPDVDAIAAELWKRAQANIGSGPIESGTYPMVLLNRSAGRILGILGGPLSGGSIWQQRSCLADSLGEAIGSELFTLIDDPTIPRGLGSHPWDGDSLRARPRTIVDRGVLKEHYIGVYHGRKLGRDVTTGGRSNWIIPPGDVPTEQLLKALPKAILVDGFLGGNSNGTTGDFSFGIRGALLEHGVPTKPLSEMNESGNLKNIFKRLSAVGDDVWDFSSVRSPTLIFDDVQFSGA